MKRLGYAPAAQKDLAEIGRHIAQDNPSRARSFVAELQAKGEQIARRPLSFRARDEVSPGLRSAVHGRYIIFFRDGQEEVRVAKIVHSARNFEGLSFD